MVNFARSSATLKKHELRSHLRAMARASEFKLAMTREQPTVHQQLHDRNRELAAENEKKLKSIIATIKMCIVYPMVFLCIVFEIFRGFYQEIVF